MLLSIAGFQGEMPRIHETQLPDAAAQIARDLTLERGILTPFRASRSAHVFGSAVEGIYRMDGAWYGWSGHVWAAPAPVAEQRFYYIEEGQPMAMVDGPSGRDVPVAIPSPTVAPSVALSSGSQAVDQDTAEETVFAYTTVSDMGEESAPSPLSTAITVSPNATVQVTTPNTTEAVRGLTRKRIYRSGTSVSGVTDLYFVQEVASTTTVTTHRLDAQPLQEPISSTAFEPPRAAMSVLTSLPNGMMAGASGKTLCFSEPWKPHAWPRSYELTTDYPIVALAAFGDALAIATTGTPYIAQGSNPEAMQLQKIESNLPCVAARGMVDLGYAAAYPSHDGLALVDASGQGRIVTSGMLTKDQWRDMQPHTMRAGQTRGLYALSYVPRGQNAREMALFDVSGQTPSMIRLGVAASGFLYDVEDGHLYFTDGSPTVWRFNDPDSAASTYHWRSKVVEMPVPVPFGCAVVDGVGEEITGVIYGDGEQMGTIGAVGQLVRLRAGLARRWEIDLTGSAEVHRIRMAGTPQELVG